MAYGHELMLGVSGRAAIAAASASIPMPITWEEYRADYEVPDELRDALYGAWDAAVAELGLRVEDIDAVRVGGRPVPKRDRDGHYAYVTGLDGVLRQTARWDLAVYYDPMECGDEPDDAVLGVSLVSRYFPTYLDWQREHGGSGLVIQLTPEVLRMIEVARRHIALVLPFIKDAPVIVKELHY